MKKLWKKFKNWLIVKLGGHLEGPGMCRVEHYHVDPQTVTAIVTVTASHDDEGSREYLNSILFSSLGGEIQKQSGLYRVYECYDPITDTNTYKVVAKLIPIK